MFGRGIDTGGWVWQDLAADWPFAEVYAFLMAKMISDALNGRLPKGTILRAPESNELYRMTLRRYERMGGDKYRFHYTAAPLDVPFDLPEPGKSAEETVLYHLVSLTWYFRRRVVDQLYQRLLQVHSMRERDRPQAAVNEVYDDLGRELMQVAAQAIIRRLDNPFILQQALNRSDAETRVLLKSLETYGDLQQHIFQAMQDGPTGLLAVTCDVYKMAMQNYDLYHTVAAAYAKLAQELPHPFEPPREGT